jgi:uncharacterized protein
MDVDNRYPGFWHAVLLCGIFIALQVAASIPFAIAMVAFKSPLASHPAFIGIANLIACAGVILIARQIGRPTMAQVFSFRRVPALAVAAVILTMPGAVILVSEFNNLLVHILPLPDWLARLFRELTEQTGQHFWGGVFLLVLVAPITEEVMFRGLILRGFLQRFSPARAFVLSAILFGATHLNPWQFVTGLVMGVIFAWWYARTRSLIPSLLGHALGNAAVVGHQSLGFEVRGFNAADSLAVPVLQPLWFDTLGVLFLVAGLWLFRLSTPRSEPWITNFPEAPPLLAPPVIVSQAVVRPLPTEPCTPPPPAAAS